MKILSVIENLRPGGAQRMLITNLAELIKRGNQCDVAVLLSSISLDIRHELESIGVRVYPLELKYRWSFPAAIWKLAGLIRKNQYDIVHGHLYFETLYLRMLKIFKVTPHMISSYHGLDYNIEPRRPLLKKIGKSLDSYSCKIADDATVAVSKAVAEHLLKHIQPKNLLIIPNSIDFDKLKLDEAFGKDETRTELGIPQNSFFIICAARFIKEKGLEFLIEAINILCLQKKLKLKLLLVGNGPLIGVIKGQIVKDKLCDNVLIKDFVPHDVLLKWIKAADIYVQPSTHESFGISVAEAMALGKPVIATDVGGLPELIEHNVSGILIQPYNPKAIADAILDIIDDEDKKTSLGLNAKARILEKFDVKVTCTQWEDLYKNCMKAS